MRQILQALAEVRRKLALIAARAFVNLADDSTRVQMLNVDVLSGETRVVERLQPYGFTSVPRDPQGAEGPEALVVFVNGDRGHGIAVVVDDRRYRLVGLQKGEAALYDDLGHRVHLKRGGIEVDGGGHQVTIKNTSKVRMESDLEVTGKAVVTGNVETASSVVAAANVSDALGSMQEMRDTFNGHVHFVNNTPGHTQPPTTPMT